MNTIYSYIKKVCDFRKAVGMHKQDEKTHFLMYASESLELLSAQTQAEKADAFADMAVVLIGYYLDSVYPVEELEQQISAIEEQAALNNICFSKSFDIVMRSNMTKVCGYEHREQTIQKYKDEGVSIIWRRSVSGHWSCYSSDNYPDKPKGKLLKPVTYKEPDWSGDEWRITNCHWNRIEDLPPVMTVMMLQLIDGSEIKGCRYEHVKNKQGWLGYSDLNNEKISNDKIKGWRYE